MADEGCCLCGGSTAARGSAPLPQLAGAVGCCIERRGSARPCQPGAVGAGTRGAAGCCQCEAVMQARRLMENKQTRGPVQPEPSTPRVGQAAAALDLCAFATLSQCRGVGSCTGAWAPGARCSLAGCRPRCCFTTCCVLPGHASAGMPRTVVWFGVVRAVWHTRSTRIAVRYLRASVRARGPRAPSLPAMAAVCVFVLTCPCCTASVGPLYLTNYPYKKTNPHLSRITYPFQKRDPGLQFDRCWVLYAWPRH